MNKSFLQGSKKLTGQLGFCPVNWVHGYSGPEANCWRSICRDPGRMGRCTGADLLSVRDDSRDRLPRPRRSPPSGRGRGTAGHPSATVTNVPRLAHLAWYSRRPHVGSPIEALITLTWSLVSRTSQSCHSNVPEDFQSGRCRDRSSPGCAAGFAGCNSAIVETANRRSLAAGRHPRFVTGRPTWTR
jgi:hypothetical protein